MAWSSSARRGSLPRDWARRCEVTRRLAGGQCEWRTDGVRCAGVGTDCGHVDPLGGHDPLNLVWLCREHVAEHSAVQVVRKVVGPSSGLLDPQQEVLA